MITIAVICTTVWHGDFEHLMVGGRLLLLGLRRLLGLGKLESYPLPGLYTSRAGYL